MKMVLYLFHLSPVYQNVTFDFLFNWTTISEKCWAETEDYGYFKEQLCPVNMLQLDLKKVGKQILTA